MLPGKGFSVHGVGEHHIRRQRIGDGKAAGETAGVAVPAKALLGPVGSEEDHFPCVGTDEIFE